MNEQRQQDYFNLIQLLLSCPNGEEPEILSANQELVDVGFLQTLEAVADMFSLEQDENTANWLRNLAMQLGEALNPDTKVDLQSLSEEEIQTYFQFLMEVMQATESSRGDSQVVYPLLAKNTDKLNGVLAEILRQWGTNRLREAEVEVNVAKSIAGKNIGNFSNLIAQFPLGNKASNIEIAITGYELVLTVYTQQAFPQYWAMTQNYLGYAYRERIRGEKAENIELAIKACSAALSVYTQQAFPQDWAMTQNNLGLVYVDRILGEKAENIELAIKAYTAALSVITRDAFPEGWAMTQNNLGIAYGERITGEKAENIELAIKAYTAALSVYTQQASPQYWAMTQNNLGVAYGKRITGEKAENIELEIKAYTAALSVYTQQAFPQHWAMTQNNLGFAYRERILGEKAENIELAITACSAALSVYTQQAFPQDWAMTLNNFATAYRERITGEKAENIELAIKAYTAALSVYTQQAFPQHWARTQNNLGITYAGRILGDKAENIELAIAAFSAGLSVYTQQASPQDWARTQTNFATAYAGRILGDKAENIELAIKAHTAALSVYTQQAFPENWARTQNNLGNAYADRILGDKAENIELAIKAHTAALSVYTQQAFPQNHAETLWNMGMTYQDTNQYTLAYNTFESAIATVESLREEIFSGEQSKRKQAEEWKKVYSRMVKVCLKLGNITQAIEYVERSKTRNLVEQILERDSKTIFPLEVVTQLEKYRNEIATGQDQIQNGKAEDPKVLAQDLQKLRQQRNELQNHYLPVGYGFQFDSFQATLDERTAIIEWYLLTDKILAFIITKKGEVTVWQSQPEDEQAFTDWADQYLQNYYNQKYEWPKQLGEELKKLASILHIDEILAQIPKHCEQLILIPHWFLHLFPLHALPVNQNSENSRYLLDLFPRGVSYAPSCQILQQVQTRQRPDFQSLFAIQNPTEDLNYTDLEVQVIQSYFNTSNVLKKTEATLTAINNTDLNTYHCTHFSCHGYFNLTNPSKSALILANAPVADAPTKPNSERYLNLRLGETHDLDKCLTLDKIFALKLEKCRLVTLSACETGLIDYSNTSDEYIGLPSGFLLAGSPSVVSSLWKVDDLSTSFLMIKFYENLQTKNSVSLALNSVSLALNEAQQWLRNLTTEEYEALLVKYDLQIKEVLDQISEDWRPLAKAKLKKACKRKPHPFAAPFYWAGFTATGI
ncbi:CHAT domain-containing protein [Brasilonema sp. CT11]|nr:CHAT domain-containing protein [Brasilonema sp. CT11]